MLLEVVLSCGISGWEGFLVGSCNLWSCNLLELLFVESL